MTTFICLILNIGNINRPHVVSMKADYFRCGLKTFESILFKTHILYQISTGTMSHLLINTGHNRSFRGHHIGIKTVNDCGTQMAYCI